MSRRRVVQFVPSAPAEPDFDAGSRTLLAVAGEVVAAEERIKGAAIEALERGDARAALRLLRRWQTEPATEIAAGLRR